VGDPFERENRKELSKKKKNSKIERGGKMGTEERRLRQNPRRSSRGEERKVG